LRTNPPTLSYKNIRLRPLRYRDSKTWKQLRRDNKTWLKEWDATLPPVDNNYQATFFQMVKQSRIDARNKSNFIWAIEVDKKFVGLVTAGNIALGSSRHCYVGYWISKDHAGRGITPISVALVLDFLFQEIKIHRVEIAIRPENAASLRIVEKLKIQLEGLRRSFIHINGAWRDHQVFVVTEEEVTGSFLERLKN
jgi:[ribosomal protein S5]-alanine N-acetyltransferase